MVLDTSAFIGGLDPFTIREEQVIPPNVEEEVKRNSLRQLRLATAIESGRIKINSPSKHFLDKIQEQATKLGDASFLSKTDMEVLALALEIKERGDYPEIVTDDFSIQNVATELGLAFVPLSTLGIKRILTWIRYCPACHKTYPANSKVKECIICGTQLKRKPQRAYKTVNSHENK